MESSSSVALGTAAKTAAAVIPPVAAVALGYVAVKEGLGPTPLSPANSSVDELRNTLDKALKRAARHYLNMQEATAVLKMKKDTLESKQNKTAQEKKICEAFQIMVQNAVRFSEACSQMEGAILLWNRRTPINSPSWTNGIWQEQYDLICLMNTCYSHLLTFYHKIAIDQSQWAKWFDGDKSSFVKFICEWGKPAKTTFWIGAALCAFGSIVCFFFVVTAPVAFPLLATGAGLAVGAYGVGKLHDWATENFTSSSKLFERCQNLAKQVEASKSKENPLKDLLQEMQAYHKLMRETLNFQESTCCVSQCVVTIPQAQPEEISQLLSNSSIERSSGNRNDEVGASSSSGSSSASSSSSSSSISSDDAAAPEACKHAYHRDCLDASKEAQLKKVQQRLVNTETTIRQLQTYRAEVPDSLVQLHEKVLHELNLRLQM